MKIAIENDTQLLACEATIAQAENMFDEYNEQEKIDEPIFYDLINRIDVEADELEQLAPETKLENILSPNDYKIWKQFPLSDKKRMLNRIRNSSDYQEYVQAVAILQQTKEAAVNTPTHSMPAQSTMLQTSHMNGNFGKVSKLLSSGKKVTKRIARDFSELPKATTACYQSFSDEQKTGGRIYNTAIKGDFVVARLVGGVIASTGTPLLFVVLPLLMFFMVMTSFFLLQSQASENAGIMPYYAQADYPSTPFNGNTISTDGCGITSMAMVVSLFKNDTITPPVLAEKANADGRYNTVLSHSAINNFAALYELGAVEEMGGPSMNCCSKQTYNLSYLQEKIQNGCPVIVSVSGGYYNPSGGGHYIALYGAGANGVFVYDPGSRAKYQASLDGDGSAWGVVFENAKHIWIFQPYSGTYLTGNTNEESVYLNLKQAGFSDAAAAGIIGNMYQESSHGLTDLKLDAESKDGSMGILQWTAGRREALEKLGRNRNKDWTDIAVQMEYLFQELNSNAQWKWTDYSSSHYSASDNITLEEFKQLSDPQLAAEIFQAKFVRPSFEESNLSYRKEKAQEVYQNYTNIQ